MRPETFEIAVELHKRRVSYWITHPNKTHPLKALHALIVKYWSLDKAMVVSRHQAMKDIIRAGNAYIRSKSPAKTNSDKVQSVCVLVWQANRRLALEEASARALEKKINAPTTNVKVVGAYREGLRYERVAKPGGLAITGAELHTAAQSGSLGNIELTGNDVNDFYALKKLLKSLTPEQIIDAGLKTLEYSDDEARAKYAVNVTKKELRWDETGIMIDTTSTTTGDPPRTAMYSADLGGNFYCRVYAQTDDNRGWFAHSSFLAGENALCAGSMKIGYGRLIEISNNSGHYQPKREHLADACRAILEHGYNPRNDGYALLIDYTSQYGPQGTGHYRFPLKLYSDNNGVVPNHLDFQVSKGDDNGFFPYVNEAAAKKRGCVPEKR
jgi:hypothetical protein